MGVQKNPDAKTGATFAITDWGIIFLGALSRAILEALEGQLEGLLQSEIGNSIIKEKVRGEVSRMFAKATALEATETAQDTKTCTNCKSENKDNAKYCDQCGKTF